MQITQYYTLSIAQKDELLRLWNNEYPVELAHENIAALDNYLNGLSRITHYLLADEQDILHGWAWAFDRDDSRWFAIILDSSVQRKGYGSILLNKLKESEKVLQGWVEDSNEKIKRNGETYRSPLAFYRKNGFTLCPDDRLRTDKVSAIKIKWAKE